MASGEAVENQVTGEEQSQFNSTEKPPMPEAPAPEEEMVRVEPSQPLPSQSLPSKSPDIEEAIAEAAAEAEESDRRGYDARVKGKPTQEASQPAGDTSEPEEPDAPAQETLAEDPAVQEAAGGAAEDTGGDGEVPSREGSARAVPGGVGQPPYRDAQPLPAAESLVAESDGTIHPAATVPGSAGNVTMVVEERLPAFVLDASTDALLDLLGDRFGALEDDVHSAKFLVGKVLEKVDNSGWGHKLIAELGEELVQELREFVNE